MLRVDFTFWNIIWPLSISFNFWTDITRLLRRNYFWSLHLNDTSFMNHSSHLNLSVRQQERSSLQREARLRLSPKNVLLPLLPFTSLLEPAEHQACWMKNFYYLEMMIWVQEGGTSASRNHVTDYWQWSSQFWISLSHNPPTNIQAWWVGTLSPW